MLRFYPYILTFLLFLSCEKEEINNIDNDIFPLELNGQKKSNGVLLNWTEVNSSKFEAYIILRSPDRIPKDIDPLALEFPVTQVERITDFEENTYLDINNIFSDTIYYQVFADVGGRFLKSDVLAFSNDLLLVSANFSGVVHAPDMQSLFIIDQQSQFIVHYNYVTEMEEKRIFVGGIENFGAYGDNGKGKELYLAKNSDDLLIYDAQTLQLKKTISYTGAIASIETNNNGLIFIADGGGNTNLHIYDRRIDATITSKKNDSNFDRNLKMLSVSTDNNILIEASRFKIGLYRFDDNGNQLSYFFESIGFNETLSLNIGVSDDGKYFIPYRNFRVFNTNLQNTLMNMQVFSNDYVFASPEKDIVYTPSFAATIKVLSLSDGQEQESFNTKLDAIRIFRTDDELICIEPIFTFGVGETLIEKIKLK